MSQETFVPSGFETFPNLYADDKLVGEFSLLDRKIIELKLSEYTVFLQRTDIMERARGTAERVRDHLIFELAYRDGVYDERD